MRAFFISTYFSICRTTDKIDPYGFRPHQQFCIASLIDLLWSVPFLRQREGDELFGIAAIHRTDFLLGFCIWVLPWLVVQVKGVGGVRVSASFWVRWPTKYACHLNWMKDTTFGSGDPCVVQHFTDFTKGSALIPQRPDEVGVLICKVPCHPFAGAVHLCQLCFASNQRLCCASKPLRWKWSARVTNVVETR